MQVKTALGRGYWGGTTSYGVWGNAVSYPSGIRDGAPAAKRFYCILEVPDGISWNLLGAKFAGMAPSPPPFNPPMSRPATEQRVTLRCVGWIILRGGRLYAGIIKRSACHYSRPADLIEIRQSALQCALAINSQVGRPTNVYGYYWSVI